MKKTLQHDRKSITAINEHVALHELDKANLVINQFINSCSHSMRGPLKSIRGLVNLLKDQRETDTMDPLVMLQLIEESTDKMENMLDDLEQFMVNSGKDTAKKTIDLNEIILGVVGGLQKETNKQSIDVTVQVEQSGPFLSDLGRIRLIVNHLLSNAITFQRCGHADKRINVRCFVDADECILSIEDNGIGIEAEERENIFRLFYRASAIGHGAGIGLFVVREALEKMDGRISVDSRVGKGSVFKVYFPNKAHRPSAS